jgi:O-antigen ligase
MGFFLSVLYFVTSYLSPETIFGALAAYRVELILAVLVFFISLPKLAGSIILKTPQSVALIGLSFAIFLSVVIGEHWPGGGMPAFLLFIPNAFAYFLVCLHCNSKKKLQIIVLMLLFVCLFVTAHGWVDLQRQSSLDVSNLSRDDQGAALETPYLFTQRNDADEWVFRVRGMGPISDPNDFAQLIVCLLPLMFTLWTPRKTLRNIAFVLLPVCALLFGAFLTHSRGAVLGLLAMAIVAARRRIGTVPAVLVAVVLFVAASALNFTGGREISADAGEDRTSLWGDSLQLLKANPLFGVGYGNLADILGHTAHNSVALCAAELGTTGLYFWSLFLFPTMRDVLVIASPEKVGEGEPIVYEKEPFPGTIRKIKEIDKAEICRLGRLVLLSLTGFLVTGWFLSRAFVMTLFLLGGFVEVVFEMALRRGMVPPRLPPARVLGYSGGLAFSMVLVLYIMLRIVNLMH